ncbi:Uncharacterised protein [Mycobacteroides abscessus subsp. massiliense]|uniref:hypothetical protein n=1 Tax=Mycobacteroides abscessus TaxID=36809 RepID=UPI0009A617AC|nr:hypothetical protein [Mycobacteroides abscessus]SKD84148.1 Uncharacterised protein [Mycobacteroides abscessus subsp. massiliense]SKD87634.1 Uncharacterised protein [Mycobacteroides abscessus subsp. massiliense]SKE39803.1 Uncharacterised protein [Mycobacteroides abscessus subsp. massiliense]SKE40821.1 Uncharacterised protein [Mycobacteroides abscessus subsp. massiliense]SKE44365.1 Uncharacterised protein [Mycobacteroides abscessus subsp. massiliense]
MVKVDEDLLSAAVSIVDTGREYLSVHLELYELEMLATKLTQVAARVQRELCPGRDCSAWSTVTANRSTATTRWLTFMNFKTKCCYLYQRNVAQDASCPFAEIGADPEWRDNQLRLTREWAQRCEDFAIENRRS